MSLLYFCPKLPGWLGAFVLFHSRAKRDFDRPYRCLLRKIYKNPENENNNVLKNHGYHIDHNFGHGQEHLATTLLTLNLLAFLLHTIAQVTDKVYQQIRQALGSRRTFFNDAEALMRYMVFPDWTSLLRFMFVQLELEPD
jgi:hypothetical protein